MKKRLLSLFLALIMTLCFTQFAYAAEETAAEPDMPSDWAVTDVYIAGAYELFSPTLTGWLNTITGADCSEIIGAVGAEGVELPDVPTRGDVIDALAAVVADKLGIAIEIPATFFAENGLIRGRLLPDGSVDLALDELVITEEAVILAKRTFEYIKYELGEDAKGVLWKVSDEDNTIYLLGSVHMLPPGMYPFSRDIMGAWDDSEILVEECDLTDVETLTNEMISHALYTDGRLLKDGVSAETYEAYKQFWEERGYTEADFEMIQPWAAASELSELIRASVQMTGAGADAFFTNIKGSRPLIALETWKFQFDMMSGYGYAYDDYNLNSMLEILNDEEKLAEAGEEFLSLPTAWKAGDLDTFIEMSSTDYDALAEEEPENADTYKEIANMTNQLLDQRNGPMADQIKTFLADDSVNDYFVVVGALHMVGETGIVAQLTEAGYTVERVS
jgi:uncharacterized protein YbaP (TraB family)